MTKERRAQGRPDGESDRALLLESLWRDARREGEETLANARAEADRIRARAESGAQQALAEARLSATRQASPEAARIRNRGVRRAAGETLELRQRIVDRLFVETGELLAAGKLPGAELSAASTVLCAEVADQLPPGSRGVLTARPADLDACRSIFAGRGVAVEVRPDQALAGGVLFTSADGRETLDNTLPTRLAALRSAPPLALYRELFPEQKG